MRLLNIKTLKLESFQDVDVTPGYAILSHRWEVDEVLFEDVEEKPEAQEIRNLQKRLEETERKLDALYRMIRKEAQTEEGPDTVMSGLQHSSTVETSQTSTRIHDSQATKKKGWAKVLSCCKIAEGFGISYVWIDTCCIDKSSSTELSETLNSMFAWYKNATVCIAYLSDVTKIWEENPHPFGPPQFSRWFVRGWTLQEILAPKEIFFYNSGWSFLGTRSKLADTLQKITGIEKQIFQRDGLQRLHSVSVAARMSWVARRQTTRPEDRAYSLLGIFDVNMPIMYGEGERNAFFRLQVMIFQMFPDYSIFIWRTPYFFDERELAGNLFAPSPTCFKELGSVERITHNDYIFSAPDLQSQRFEYKPISPYAMCVQLLTRPLHQKDKLFEKYEDRFKTYLGCVTIEETEKAFTVTLIGTEPGQYQRYSDDQSEPQIENFDDLFSESGWSLTDIFISVPRPKLPNAPFINENYYTISLNCALAHKSGVEIGGFWGEEIEIDEALGERIYTSNLWPTQRRTVFYFTVRNVKSGEMCGFVLTHKDEFEASMVYGLDETQFTDSDSFYRLLSETRVPKSQNLTRDILFYNLKDGGHLFLSFEDQLAALGWDQEANAQLRVGIVQ